MYKLENVFVAYRVISRLYFYLPILVVYFISRGIGYLEIGLLIATYSLLVGLLDGRVKSISKLLGLKKTIATGELLKATGLGVLFYADNFSGLLLGQLFSGAGYLLTIGIDSQLLSRGLNNKDRYSAIETRSHSFVLLSIMISGVFGGFAAHLFGPSAAIAISIPGPIISALIALQFRESEVSIKHESRTQSESTKTLENKALLFYVTNYAIVRGIFMAVFVAYFPIIYFVKLETPLLIFGIVLGGYTLVSVLASKNHLTIFSVVGERTALGMAYFLLITVVILIATSSKSGWLVYLAPVLLGYAAGITRPATISLLSKHCDDSLRDYLMSKSESVCAVLTALIVISVNTIIQYFGIDAGLFYLATLTILILTLLGILNGYQKRPNLQ